MNPLFDTSTKQELELALDCLHDSQLFEEHVLNETVIQIYLDSDLQDQLHWLAKCDWDLTHAKLSYQPGSIIKGWPP